MIKSIKIEGFKSLNAVNLSLGALNVFIGTNASGKSNLFDALRFLQGIGYGFTIEEILNGKPKSANSEVWDSIRGGSGRAAFEDKGKPAVRIKFEVTLRLGTSPFTSALYSIEFDPKKGYVHNERLNIDGARIYDSTDVSNQASRPVFRAKYYSGSAGQPPQLEFERLRPVLHQLQRHRDCLDTHKDAIASVIRTLSNTQRIDPLPVILRNYSTAHSVRRMGEHGENFAALVQEFSADPKRRGDYVSWLRQLSPAESVDDVRILHGAVGEPLFALTECGRERPAQMLSDGTLRFAAIAAAFFQTDLPDILTIEEIENGIHPSRLRLLVELLRSQTKHSKKQVMVTTHSPIVLAWMKREEYASVFFCRRDPETGASSITPLSDVPNFLSIVDKQPIGELFAEGWLEGAL